MNRKLTAAAATFAATAATLAAVAAAQPSSARQRVTIEVKGTDVSSFVLTPTTSGAIKRENGTAAFCCWSQRHIVRDGQVLDLNDPQMTLTGKRGTIVARNRIVWMDLPNGLSIFTGTWKVVSGSGDYAGLTGGGLAAGLELVNGRTSVRFTGSLSPK